LQASIGNQAVLRLQRSPDGRAEVRPQVLHRKCADCEGEEVRLARKEASGSSALVALNGSSAGRESEASSPRTGPFDSVAQVLRTPGVPLPVSARLFMESRFHHDLGNVRLHLDAAAAASAYAVSALAYTVGNHVVFNNGQYAFDTPTGRRLLAHELAHVVSHDARPQVSPERSQLAISAPGDVNEQMADCAADRIMSGARFDVPRLASSPRTVFRSTALPPSPRGRCRGTERFPLWRTIPAWAIHVLQGHLVHQVIQVDYVARKAGAATDLEYMIPDSGSGGGIGFVDIANHDTHEMFEIKPADPRHVAEGESDVARKIRSAYVNCGEGWQPGTRYLPRTIIMGPGLPTLEIVLAAPGVIGYTVSWRRDARAVATHRRRLRRMQSALNTPGHLPGDAPGSVVESHATNSPPSSSTLETNEHRPAASASATGQSAATDGATDQTATTTADMDAGAPSQSTDAGVPDPQGGDHPGGVPERCHPGQFCAPGPGVVMTERDREVGRMVRLLIVAGASAAVAAVAAALIAQAIGAAVAAGVGEGTIVALRIAFQALTMRLGPAAIARVVAAVTAMGPALGQQLQQASASAGGLEAWLRSLAPVAQ
jgi:hypothetical protein